MRTIMTKTGSGLSAVKEILADDEEGRLKQEMVFFEKILKEDMNGIDAELFPVEELHLGELNPAIGRQVFSH